MDKQKAAAIYCRTGSRQVAGPDQSIASQILIAQQYAEKRGYTVAKTYIDCPASGMRSRKELSDLLTDAQQGLFQIVITRDEFRIARSQALFSEAMLVFLKARIRVVFLQSRSFTSLIKRGLLVKKWKNKQQVS